MATPTPETAKAQMPTLQAVGLWLSIIVPMAGFAAWLSNGYTDLVKQQTTTTLTMDFLKAEVSEMKKDQKEQPAKLADAIIRAINDTEPSKSKR